MNWDQGGDDANPNTEYLKAFTNGSLWDYIGDFDVYSSPQDPRLINDPETYRLRSYSFSAFAGKEAYCRDCSTGPVPAADSYSQFRDPSNQLYLVRSGHPRGQPEWIPVAGRLG